MSARACTIGVRAVELADCLARVVNGLVRDEGDTLRSPGAVILKVHLGNRSNSVEELLGVCVSCISDHARGTGRGDYTRRGLPG